MKVKVKEKRNGTCNIRLEIFDSILVIFFIILATRQHMFTQKVTDTHTRTHAGTHTHTHTHTYLHTYIHTVRDKHADYRQNLQNSFI